MKTVVQNRKARHDYQILDRYEAGIELRGTEVKSLRQGKVNLTGGYATVEDGELILRDVHISPYDAGSRMNHDPTRPRRLLMHKREIRRLSKHVDQPGYTLVPLSIYFNDSGKAKVELALARGKSSYDKRDSIKREEDRKRIKRAMSTGK